MSYETIRIDQAADAHNAVITLNRPAVKNVVSRKLVDELGQSLDALEADDQIGCIVLTGTNGSFSNGLDVEEFHDLNYADVFKFDLFSDNWERLARCRKPVIAAVNGSAYGIGCELALMCDIVIASETARFGLNEINLGMIPGLGGTQRLARLVGKSCAMEMCLTGRPLEARDALRIGLVSRVTSPDALMEEARDLAEKIASKSRPVAMMVKESVNMAMETHLSQGLQFEKRMVHSTFSLADHREAIEAHLEGRQANFRQK